MPKKYLILGAVVALGIFGLVLWRTQQHSTIVVSPLHGRYVALGDSVAAGFGLQDYSDASACDRTQQAYPVLIAHDLRYHLQSVACSGATTQQGLIGPQIVNRASVVAQVKAATSGEKPQLITMTIGANDAHWTDYIKKCYTAVCGSAADTAGVQSGITQATTHLQTALQTIKNTYPTAPPLVIITGYYKLFGTTSVANCLELTGLDSTEQAWIAQLQTSLDAALQTAVQEYSFAQFVPIQLTGHELCSTTPWIQGLGGKAPYHPTAAGQSAIARQIMGHIKGGQ